MEKTWGASHKAKVKVGPKRNLIINIRFLKPEILNNQEPFEIINISFLLTEILNNQEPLEIINISFL